jgi:nitrous oxide reductase accessory protein NosL
MRRTLTTAVIAALALLAAACGTSHSTVNVTPSESAAAHAAAQRGITVIEQCTPNGKAMIGGIVNHTATGLTYIQVAKTFKSSKNRAAIWACASKKAQQIPGTNPKAAMETCFAKSDAATTAVRHPFHAAHHPAQTAEALLNAAAVCVGNEV